MTKAQQAALDWLREHNGTGIFGKNGVLLAAGEWAPVTRQTWNALRDLGHVTIFRIGTRGPARVAVRETA
jgi:L-lysine 2,3-aminomutase